MGLTISQVDAFADSPFQDNSTVVCPLDAWLDDEYLQAIVEENNLSETALVVGRNGDYRLRQSTPQVEVDLCGRATLATAWAPIHKLDSASSTLRSATRSGELSVRREGDSLAMDFPVERSEPCAILDGLLEALGIAEAEALKTDDYLVAADDEKTIAVLVSDFARLKGLPCRGVAVIVRSQRSDFAPRWLGPNVGINEDPMISSTYISPALYWAQRLGEIWLSAEQGRARKKRLECDARGEWAIISGKVALHMSGTFCL